MLTLNRERHWRPKQRNSLITTIKSRRMTAFWVKAVMFLIGGGRSLFRSIRRDAA